MHMMKSYRARDCYGTWLMDVMRKPSLRTWEGLMDEKIRRCCSCFVRGIHQGQNPHDLRSRSYAGRRFGENHDKCHTDCFLYLLEQLIKIFGGVA